MKIEQSIEISQPPSVVYDFLMDEENLPLWLTNFVRMEHVSGEPGEIGAISKHFYNERGRSVEYLEELTMVKENEILSTLYENENMKSHIQYELLSVNDGSTRLKVSSDVELKGFFSRLLSPLVRNAMVKRMGKDLEKLKDAIEELAEIE